MYQKNNDSCYKQTTTAILINEQIANNEMKKRIKIEIKVKSVGILL